MTKRTLFGTDGIRGLANTAPMTAEMALKVAQAAALQFRNGDHRHTAVIGKDTRLSGYLLEPALTAGFISMGMDVILLGPLPTPAVAMLTRSLRADLGVMLSASHNPYHDNGIKLFGPDGYKLSDAVEEEIEARMDQPFELDLATADKLGRARRLDDELGRYVEFVKNTFPRGQRLDGMKIAVDCAHGAAYKAAPSVLWELGADIITIGNEPNGFNINDTCGATCPEAICKATVNSGADIGIALDGDADRVLICDEKGQVIDGDQIMGLIAKNWHDQSLLKGGAVVATVMSNLGLERYLAEISLSLKRMPVGDRYVVDHMRANNFNLGGEQSGHIILGDYSTTGDGLIAALQILSIVEASDKPASEICRVFDPLPQLLKNVRIERDLSLESGPVQQAIEGAEQKLGDAGRILVRKSGTEPLVRVMVEGDDQALIESIAGDVCDVIESSAA